MGHRILGNSVDKKFVGIPIRCFIGGKRAVADLYVKLGENHYIKLVLKGTEFDIDRLSHYKNLKIDFLYVLKTDFGLFALQNLKVAMVASSSSLSSKQKLSILARAVENVFIEFSALGVSKDSVSRAKEINRALYKFIGSKPKLADIVLELSESSLELVKHSLATSMFASLIILTLGWKEETVVHSALGGLLHDIGLLNMPAEMLWRSRANMTTEEQTIFDEHPWKGGAMLNQVGVPDEVIAIVIEHHDLPSSPANLSAHKSKELYPLSRAVAFADYLAELTIRSEGNAYPKDFKQAVELADHTRRQDFPMLYFEAAKKLLTSQAA